MKSLHRRADRRDPGGDQGKWSIEALPHPAQRRLPMALLSEAEVFSLLDRDDDVGP